MDPWKLCFGPKEEKAGSWKSVECCCSCTVIACMLVLLDLCSTWPQVVLLGTYMHVTRLWLCCYIFIFLTIFSHAVRCSSNIHACGGAEENKIKRMHPFYFIFSLYFNCIFLIIFIFCQFSLVSILQIFLVLFYFSFLFLFFFVYLLIFSFYMFPILTHLFVL